MKKVFRIAAVTSSVLLVSGYIMYRGHGADRVLPGSKGGPIPQPMSDQSALSSSKSGRIFVSTTSAAPSEPIFLSGSKSAGHVIDSKDVVLFGDPATQPVPASSTAPAQPATTPAPR